MDTDEKQYKIRITGEGYSIEDKITKTQLASVLSVIATDSLTPTTDFSTSHIKNRVSQKKRTNPGNFTPVQVRQDIEALTIDPISPTYGNYWSNKSKALKLLWILAALNEKGIENINQRELEFIAEKMGDNLPKKFITSLLDPHKKAGRIAPGMTGTTRTVRILKPGLDYVKELSNPK